MEVEVEIPIGCYGGSEIIVNAGSTELIVNIPDGLGPGDKILVAVPEAPADGPSPLGQEVQEMDIMSIIVPEGVNPGNELIVTAPDGRELAVILPPGLQSGDSMEVSFPRDVSPTPSTPSGRSPTAPPPAEHSPRPAHAPSEARAQPPELSDDSDSDSDNDAGARFGVGQPVEVLRNDGGWTLATVIDYEDGGGTYSVRLVDGRCKYFVEEEDLRIPRFLLLSTASI